MSKWVQFTDIYEDLKFERIIDLSAIKSIEIHPQYIELISDNANSPVAIVREGLACQSIEKYFKQKAIHIKNLGDKYEV